MNDPKCELNLRVLVLAALALTITSQAWAQSESILYSFTGGSDGSNPLSGVIPDGKGNLYGTTESGGANGAGTVFELTPSSNGWTEQVLYSFNGFVNRSDGAIPFGGLAFDSKGNLFGTTISGGTSGQGTAFELSPGSNGTWTEKVIYTFTGPPGVGSPQRFSFLVDSAGNLYANSITGGTYSSGCTFELVVQTNGTYTEKILHSFTGGNDGSEPYGPSLIFDAAGNLYGSASGGGVHDYGVVFKLTPQSNGTWTEKVLYSFTGVGGVSGPFGQLVMDGKGNIYGTAFDAFELSPGTTGVYTEKNLHFFSGGKDGAHPSSGLISDSQGNLYGATTNGGAHRGTVFELSPNSNGTWTEKVLHSFLATGGDGVYPGSPLSRDSQGHLYGTTSSGGSSNFGVVYEVTP